MEFNSSNGWNTPRRAATYPVEPSHTDFASLWARRTDRSSGIHSEARRLEEKVARRQQYVAKAQDYQNVCVELNKLKDSLASGGIPTDACHSATSPAPQSTSPTPYTSASSQSPLSRFNSIHQRSSSISSRPTTPATPSPSRTYTPAPSSPLRTQTPAPFVKTQTPMTRPYTPAPTHNLRSMTQTPSLMRTTTPAPPPIPTKPRRLSTPSTPAPPKMVRSTSEEKAELHQIWIPPQSPDPPLRTPSRSATRIFTTASSRFSPSAAR
ncbi:hypothetical protein C0989_006981 [Termitomyces sp. Mn162]|nr:hypothetical protein C0989_006981 [Termitomyces sp. Mn162]